jgi:hypothetical protein
VTVLQKNGKKKWKKKKKNLCGAQRKMFNGQQQAPVSYPYAPPLQGKAFSMSVLSSHLFFPKFPFLLPVP